MGALAHTSGYRILHSNSASGLEKVPASLIDGHFVVCVQVEMNGGYIKPIQGRLRRQQQRGDFLIRQAIGGTPGKEAWEQTRLGVLRQNEGFLWLDNYTEKDWNTGHKRSSNEVNKIGK